MKINIGPATPDRASHIASLIMEAMNPGCCQNLLVLIIHWRNSTR